MAGTYQRYNSGLTVAVIANDVPWRTRDKWQVKIEMRKRENAKTTRACALLICSTFDTDAPVSTTGRTDSNFGFLGIARCVGCETMVDRQSVSEHSGNGRQATTPVDKKTPSTACADAETYVKRFLGWLPLLMQGSRGPQQ